MASKKYYCVRKGKVTGVFDSWDNCKTSVEGYPNAEFKGFATLEEAKNYLGEQYALRFDCSVSSAHEEMPPAHRRIAEAVPAHKLPEEGQLLAYVDGSYNDAVKKYAFGCVFILPDGRIFAEYGNGDNEQSLQHRNVTGEMLGAMFAVRFAMLNGFSGLELRYDYEGIEKWVTGEWRAKTELTGKYAEAMRKWGKDIKLHFTKVPAHSNVYYNELADKLAKTGLTEGNGVPKVRLIEDMEEYHGTDQTE